jgi:hypothetical protein
MKFGIAALAAIGVEGRNHFEHNIKVAAVDTIYKKYYGGSVIDTCPAAPERYHDGEFIRILMKEAHKSSIIATYDDVTEMSYPVSDDCFGDWMKEAWKPIHETHHKMHEDFWGVTRADWEAYGTAWLDMSFKNTEACQIKKIGDDMISHCMEDEDACWNKMGHMRNFFENIVPIAQEYLQMFWSFKNEELCVDDKEIIAGISTRYAEWINVVKMVHGLEIEWYGNNDVHHTMKEYKKAKKEWKSEHHPYLEKIMPWVVSHVKNFFDL